MTASAVKMEKGVTYDNAFVKGKLSANQGVNRHFRKFKKIGSNLYNEELVGVTDKILTTTRGVADVARKVFCSDTKFINFIRATELFAVSATPFAFYNIGKGVKELVKGDKQEKIDAALMMTSELGTIGDAVASFAGGLHTIGAVSETAVAWAGPLAIASAALSLASIASNARGLWQSHKLKKNLLGKQNKKEYTVEDYTKTVGFLQAQKDCVLKQHFNIKGEKLKTKVNEIWKDAERKLSSGDAEKVKEGHSKMGVMLKAFKDRIFSKKMCHILSIVAAVVSTVGLGVLFFTPLAPVGYSLIALGAAISVGKFFYNMVKQYRFKKALGLPVECPMKSVVRSIKNTAHQVKEKATQVYHKIFHPKKTQLAASA